MGRTSKGRGRKGRPPLRTLPTAPCAGEGTPMRARSETPPVTGRSSVPRKDLCCGALIAMVLVVCLFGGARARTFEYYHADGTSQGYRRITCYTCVNVSSNDECNRFAIDRPCPEGGDYCLTLHLMEGKDSDRSLLVNKRCASLEDCTGDSTGCVTAYGQTQCISCCDQPYCNDSVPSNETDAVFYRSSACSNALGMYRVIWVITSTAALKILGGLT